MKYTKLLSLFTLLLIIGLSSCKKEEIIDIQEPVLEELVPTISSTNQLVFNVQSNSADGLDLDCFTVDFPFGLNADGEITTVNSEEEFFEVLESEPLVIDFVYPVNVTYDDGETAVANNGEELGELFAACIPDTGWSGNDGFPAFLICDINSCYQLVYPIGLNDGQGNDFSAASEEEFVELIVNNPELYFNFPISLIDEDGMIVTANNDDELFGLVASCDNNYNPGIDTTNYGIGGIGCLAFSYPFDVVDFDGNVVTLNDENDYANAMISGIQGFVYPLSVIDADGNIVVVNSDEELANALFDCFDGPILTPIIGHILQSSLMGGTCYDLVYPLTGSDMFTGETIEITSDQGALDLVNNSTGDYTLDFPLSVVKISTGETVTIADIEAYFLFLSDCQ